MVVRGGYGIFYSAAQFDNTNILQLNPPTAGSLTVTNPTPNPVATIENPVPAVLYPTNPIFNVVSVPQDRLRHNAYMQNFNLQLSRQFRPERRARGRMGGQQGHARGYQPEQFQPAGSRAGADPASPPLSRNTPGSA